MRTLLCTIVGLSCFQWLPVCADARFDAAVKLVKRNAPSVKYVVSQGARVGFRDLGYENECVVKLQALEILPDHVTTINFYDVNVCNSSVKAQF